MRKLPILAAVKHALNSVIAYRGTGIRIGLLWMIILLALNFAGEFLIGQPPEPQPGRIWLFVLVQIAVNLIALSSIAVNWNRFVLRDELPAAHSALRLDDLVWRYAGNWLLIILMTFLPVAALALVLSATMSPAAILVLPAAAVAGTTNFMLSLKLPAIALGRTDFGLTDAMKASEGNFWQVMGVLLLWALIVFAPLLMLFILAALLSHLPQVIAVIIELPLSVAVNLFVILFSVSLVTSLYGFFVERRDF
jgi:hypothetical protein